LSWSTHSFLQPSLHATDTQRARKLHVHGQPLFQQSKRPTLTFHCTSSIMRLLLGLEHGFGNFTTSSGGGSQNPDAGTLLLKAASVPGHGAEGTLTPKSLGSYPHWSFWLARFSITLFMASSTFSLACCGSLACRATSAHAPKMVPMALRPSARRRR